MPSIQPVAVAQRIGFEVELLAPVGSSRKTLAEHIAARIGGSVRACFHLDSEPSKVKGRPIFYHLTQGFEVLDSRGALVAKCVDDITLQRDLNKHAKPQAGWYRVVSDDVRFLRLLKRHTPAEADIAHSLVSLGELFGTQPQLTERGVYRLVDEADASLALAAPLPGERERACELVTAPLPANDRETLPLLLECARDAGFLLPNEGATHIHFDGEPFCSAPMLANVMHRLHQQREELRERWQTNPYCRRLGAWSDEVLAVINQPDFTILSWDEAKIRLIAAKPTKYCDFNIRNLLLNNPDKHTLEIRILPSTLDAGFILQAVDECQALFAQASQN